MVTNLLQPWILARLVSGAAVAALLAVAVVTAWRVLRHWRVGATSEGQLALEKRAELVATVVQTALVMAVAGLALTVLAADRIAPSIRGAMCAYGVFASTDGGFLALTLSAATAAACALWLVLHRLDLRMSRPDLTRRKFLALFFLAPLVWLDLAAAGAFAWRLDLEMVASCCSVDLGAARDAVRGAGGGPRDLAFGVAVVASFGAAGAALWARRRPGAASAWSAAILASIAAGAALPAITGYVAPHVYESPSHACPFCLLHGDVGGIGWPLFAALFAGTVLGAALGLVESHRRRAPEPAEASALERRLGGLGALAWAVVLVLLVFPVARYGLATGASLFGGP